MNKVKKQDGVTSEKSVAGLIIAVLVSLTVSVVVCPCAQAATGWSKTYGGANAEGWDNLYPVVLQTSDGGFLITGSTTSYGAGSNDAYLVKTDANGEMQWQKTYGGPLNESAFVVCKTSNGGYALMCTTNSYGAGGNDFWLLKTDANGNLQWNKTYGGTSVDNGYQVSQTADGGYALFGETNSFGAGGYDLWVIKTDAAGNMQWNRTYGAAGNDMASSLILAADGGYAVASWSTSFGGFKALFIKTDSSGNMLWNKTYSLGAASWADAAIQTADGGYAIVGVTYPTTKRDAWLIKTDSSGNMLWNKTYGGTGDDTGWALVQMDGGGYAIVGVTSSFGAGGVDGWLFRTDSSGNMLWNKTYGGAGTEFIDDIIRTSDGGYVLAGFTDSFGAGNSDLWLIKTDDFGVIARGSITLTPAQAVAGSSVNVTGTGFAANTAVGIGFGAEVQVNNEWMIITGPFDVGNGPYTGFTTRLPIKPTTFRISINISSTVWFQTASDVAGNGTLNNGLPSGNVTLVYVTGNWTRFTTSPVSSSPFYKHICNYTTYEYNVTPVAGVTADASGSFTTSITVPSVSDGIYNVTAIDASGNLAINSLNVSAQPIPEGLTIVSIVLLSSVVVLVGSYLGKRPKIRNSNHVIA